MEQPGRSVGQDYSYGNNGQMRERETFEGAYSAEFWGYDSRLGRRWEQDPLSYEDQSPYVCFNNNPIFYADPSGLEAEGNPIKIEKSSSGRHGCGKGDVKESKSSSKKEPHSKFYTGPPKPNRIKWVMNATSLHNNIISNSHATTPRTSASYLLYYNPSLNNPNSPNFASTYQPYRIDEAARHVDLGVSLPSNFHSVRYFIGLGWAHYKMSFKINDDLTIWDDGGTTIVGITGGIEMSYPGTSKYLRKKLSFISTITPGLITSKPYARDGVPDLDLTPKDNLPATRDYRIVGWGANIGLGVKLRVTGHISLLAKTRFTYTTVDMRIPETPNIEPQVFHNETTGASFNFGASFDF